ncbi:MAG: FtsQ-type POTRA domain-containing protein [Gammaproteobacteria bacterium]|nr:FtsQ-type POTRA domain-containing protein [Gammaproteobacteria bacterium]MDH5630407.1 FtsQ-type POTRA domain-containing protein [Gammaproteobacteria bacterium]
MSKDKMAVRNPDKKSSDLAWTRKVNFKLLFTGLMTALIVVAGIYSMSWIKEGTDDIWPVKKIVIAGDLKYLSSETVVKKIEEMKPKGMLVLDIDKVRETVKTMDWVLDASIRKQWPDSIYIEIVEDKPIAMINGHILTDKGSQFETSEKSIFIKGLPTFTVSDKSSQDVSSEQIKEYEWFKNRFRLIDKQLEKVIIDEIDQWQLDFSDGVKVFVGGKEKMQRVERLIGSYYSIDNRNSIKKIDLRYHNGFAVNWQQDKS